MLLELAMIVKNSGQMLTDVLYNIKPYIDHWTILDTGSTDGTQSVILDVLSDVPGNLYEEPFIDFLTTRNRNLDLTQGRCKYTLILDDSYFLNGGQQLREYLSYTTQDHR